MKNQIEEQEKKRRVKIIQEISDKKLQLFLESNINTENEVIIEKKRDKQSNLLKGITKNYINVLIDAPDAYKDTFQKVFIKGFTASKKMLIAEIHQGK